MVFSPDLDPICFRTNSLKEALYELSLMRVEDGCETFLEKTHLPLAPFLSEYLASFQ